MREYLQKLGSEEERTNFLFDQIKELMSQRDGLICEMYKIASLGSGENEWNMIAKKAIDNV